MNTNHLSRIAVVAILFLAFVGVIVVAPEVRAEESLKTREQTLRARQLEHREALKENIVGKTMNKGWSKVPRVLVKERFDHAVANLENIAERVEKRIKILEDDGKDMKVAKEHLALANESIADAKEIMEKVKEKIEDLRDSGETPSDEEREEIKNMFKSTKEALIAAHNALKDAVKEIKNNTDIENDDNAATSEENSN